MIELNVMSFDVGREYSLVRNFMQRRFLTNFIKSEDCNVVMLRGDNVGSNINLKKLDDKYNMTEYKGGTGTLYKNNLTILSEVDYPDICNVSLTRFDNKFLLFINVNLESVDNIDDLIKICDRYGDKDSDYYVARRVVAGKIPSKVNMEAFSELVGLKNVYCKKYDDYSDYVLASDNLGINYTRICPGIVDILNVGESYPVVTSLCYKKTK